MTHFTPHAHATGYAMTIDWLIVAAMLGFGAISVFIHRLLADFHRPVGLMECFVPTPIAKDDTNALD